MVSAEDVLFIYHRLADNGIEIWLTGGWGIDALLGRQTRPHKDLDALLSLDDMRRMHALLSQNGYSLKEHWPENTWVLDGSGQKTASAYVLKDSAGCEFDVHAVRFDEHGNGVPVWEDDSGLIFTKANLAGAGAIAGFPIRCITVEMQVTCHRGYELPEQHLLDLGLLHEKFAVE